MRRFRMPAAQLQAVRYGLQADTVTIHALPDTLPHLVIHPLTSWAATPLTLPRLAPHRLQPRPQRRYYPASRGRERGDLRKLTGSPSLMGYQPVGSLTLFGVVCEFYQGHAIGQRRVQLLGGQLLRQSSQGLEITAADRLARAICSPLGGCRASRRASSQQVRP